MTVYPEGENERRVTAAALTAVVTQTFRRCGMSGEDAELLTETLVVADLRGVHSHGVLRVPDYVRKLTTEGVDPRGRPRVVRDNGSALVVDGGNSMGQIGAAFAMGQAIERARTHQVALAAVRGSNHCGAMAYFPMLALSEDMIGVAATNALPTMAPWGGAEKILGINPLAVAIPAGEERPIVYDAAFSGSSHGKLRVYDQKGLEIPAGWAFDRDGRPTTDAGRALEGLLQPIGAYKGTGLALVMGVFSSLLSGAAYGTELGDMVAGPRAGEDGHVFMAIRIAAFEEPARFKARVDGIVREIHACRLAPGFERIYVPGEPEALAEARYRKQGIPLNAETLEGVIGAARSAGADPAPLEP